MTATPLFIADQAQIRALLEKWKVTGPDTYVDPSTGHEWLLYPLPDFDGLRGLRRRREITLTEALDFIAAAETDAAAAAAGLYLLDGDEAYEHFPTIFARCEEVIRRRESDRSLRNVVVALYWMGIEGSIANRRSIIGKSMEQIEADTRYFVDASRQAQDLREAAESLLGAPADTDESIFGT